MDIAILNAIHAHSNELLTHILVALTNFGDPFIVAPFGVVLVSLLLRLARYRQASLITMWLLGTSLSVSGIKLIVERMRPALWPRQVIETSYSFPSGHAAGSFIIACTLAYLLWPYRQWRPLVITLASLYVLLIGFSRLYLGVHYPSDIIGGWLVAAGWFGTVLTLDRYVRYRASARKQRQ